MSPQNLIYTHSWYLDIVSPGWHALIEDDYKSVFPLTFRKKAGINYLFQPYFTQQLGLFSDQEIISDDSMKEFLEAIPEKFKLIEIQLNASNKIEGIDGFSINPKLTHNLDLSKDYDLISTNFSENLRRNIKKAQKAEVKIINQFPFRNIITLFRDNKGAGISNLKQSDYEIFITLLTTAEKMNLIDCRGIYNSEGKPCAGAVFLKSPLSYIFLFSATSTEAKESGYMSYLIDSFIKEHANEKKILDFEGSMDKNLARFYKSFGSQEVVYLQILKNKLPLVIRWLK